jgi:hypothetical protein
VTRDIPQRKYAILLKIRIMRIGGGIQNLRVSIFWDVLQRQWIVCYWRFGTVSVTDYPRTQHKIAEGLRRAESQKFSHISTFDFYMSYRSLFSCDLRAPHVPLTSHRGHWPLHALHKDMSGSGRVRGTKKKQKQSAVAHVILVSCYKYGRYRHRCR